MDVFEYARLRELYGKVYAPREEEVVGEEVQEESPEELDEFFRVLKPGESIKDADARTKAENEKAAKTRDKVLPYSGPNARTELAKKQKEASKKKEDDRVRRDAAVYKAGGGDAGRKEREANTKGNKGLFGRKGGGGEAAYETRKQGEQNLYKDGGGDAARKSGLTRQQIIDKGISAQKGKTKTKPPAETKTKPPAETKTKPPVETKTKPPVETKTKPQSTPPAPAKNRMASASKADRSAAWAKANPTLANKKKTANPLMKKMGLNKPTAPKPETKPAPTAKASPAAPAPAAKPMSRIAKATSNVKPFKPMKEEFDIIYDHLVESGFGPDEALKIMVEMPAEKRQQILEKELSIEDQMRISREHNRKSPEEKKEANKKAMGDRPKAEPKKDERTDAEKMADATGPRKGSNYRGD